MNGILKCTALLCAAGVSASSVQATIIELDDFSSVAGSSSTQDLGTTITNDPAVYLVGTMTWLPDVLTNGFSSAQFWSAAGERSGPVKQFNSANIGFGQNNFAVSATNPDESNIQVDLTPGVTTTYTFVYKIDQIAGDLTFWVDPDLGMDEASNASNGTLAGRTDQNDYTQVRLRGL